MEHAITPLEPLLPSGTVFLSTLYSDIGVHLPRALMRLKRLDSRPRMVSSSALIYFYAYCSTSFVL